MTRFGWIVLGLFLAAGVIFASMLSFGPGRSSGAGHHADVPQDVIAGRSIAIHRLRTRPAALVIPVAGYPAAALRDSWGDARDDGERAHHGTDLMAPAGTPVVAAAAGTVEKLFDSDDGGTTLYIRSPEGVWSYYYAHLAGYAAGMREGLHVRAGQPLGYVGDTGNAGAGNTHLHFGVSRMRVDDRWWQGEPVNPYPLLAGRAARR